MKRTIVLNLTPQEVKQAIVEFACNKYYDQPNYAADGGIEAAKAEDATFVVDVANSNTRHDPESLIISAKVEVSHEFDTSSS